MMYIARIPYRHLARSIGQCRHSSTGLFGSIVNEASNIVGEDLSAVAENQVDRGLEKGLESIDKIQTKMMENGLEGGDLSITINLGIVSMTYSNVKLTPIQDSDST